jgi:hypothetical protein
VNVVVTAVSVILIWFGLRTRDQQRHTTATAQGSEPEEELATASG